MREIKFRFWDIYDKRWINMCNVGGCDGGAYDIWKNQYYPDVIVQQYTGLKDKNGKEIYEGDIVKTFACNDDTEFYAPVAFCPHRGYYLDSEIERYDRIVYDGGVCLGPSCEVIGNIFENPELLEQ